MNRRILVVEDDEDGRELIGELLALNGFQPVLAADGLAALDILRAERPCVILLDLMMPRMNGWQFRQAQLAIPDLQDIPVVVVSADGSLASKAKEVGAAGFVRKPVDPTELLAMVRTHCPWVPDTDRRSAGK